MIGLKKLVALSDFIRLIGQNTEADMDVSVRQ